jgi:predicted deacylase
MAHDPWETLESGKTWRGNWDPGLSGVSALPVMAIRGATDGPTLLATGGVHGDEYEGPAAIARVFEHLDGDRLRGMVLGLPVLHVTAWEARSRVSPADGADLNRVFPGRTGEGVGPTAALAQAVFDTFVRRCDVLVDLHSGGASLIHLPLAGWYAGGTGEAERLARGFGTAFHPWLLPEVPGVLSYEAHRAGKVAVGAEWHGGARLDPAGMEAYAAALRHVQVSLGMLPLGPHEEGPVPDTRLPISGGYQETPVGGLFMPTVALGEQVALGALLGTVRDPLGEQVTEVRAARAGIVAAVPHRPLLHAGDRVAYLG